MDQNFYEVHAPGRGTVSVTHLGVEVKRKAGSECGDLCEENESSLRLVGIVPCEVGLEN
jgi:hypothetical protein